METEIKLGDKVRCKHSGFTGVATSKTEFINGCIQYDVIPKVGKDNKIPEGLSIDSQSLEVIDKSKEKKVIKKERTGGAMRKTSLMRGY